MKKVRFNSQWKKFQNSLPRRRIDPTIRLEPLILTINSCFTGPKYRVQPGTLSGETAREAILELLKITSELNKSKLWIADWEMPRGFCWDAIPASSQAARNREIATMHELLRSTKATSKDFVSAMETICRATISMLMEFSVAMIPEGGFDKPIRQDQRYMCAALLRPLVELLNRFWYPIRDKVKRANG